MRAASVLARSAPARGVCGSTHALEFHHVDARALGGKGTSAEKVMLTCHGHNHLYACQDFGLEVMDGYAGRGRKRGRSRG